MSFDQVLTLIQTIAVIVSLGFTVVFSVLNLRKASAAEERTEKDTKILATQLEEIALAIHKQGEVTLGIANQRNGVRWELEWAGGDRYSVKNVGDEIATEVSILSDETLPVFEMPDMPIAAMEPGDVADFMAVRTMGTRDATISIAYTNPSGEAKVWGRALPFKNK
jgi:hypothetical protein